MNKSNLLFEINETELWAEFKEPAMQKKIKKISSKQWKKWEMHETFIEALCAMDTDKIFVFKIVCRKGELYYSIEQSSNGVTKDDIEYIMKFFVNRGWEVINIYSTHYKTYGGRKTLKGLYIRGKK